MASKTLLHSWQFNFVKSDIITLTAACVLNLKYKYCFLQGMRATVNYALRVAVYNIEGNILGKSVRGNHLMYTLIEAVGLLPLLIFL